MSESAVWMGTEPNGDIEIYVQVGAKRFQIADGGSSWVPALPENAVSLGRITNAQQVLDQINAHRFYQSGQTAYDCICGVPCGTRDEWNYHLVDSVTAAFYDLHDEAKPPMSAPSREQLNDLVADYGAAAFWGWATVGVLAGILAWREWR